MEPPPPPPATMGPGEMDALLRAAADFASYPGAHGDDAVRQFLEQFPLPKLLGALQSQVDVPETIETVAECLDKVFSSRYGASLLPSYGEFIQAGLLTDSKNIRQLACKAVIHLLEKAGDSAVAVDTFVKHNLYPLLINCLIEGDEKISAITLDAIKCLAEIPRGIDIIFPPDGQGSLQLDKVAAQSSSTARIRILSLIAKLFAVSGSTATAIRDSNLLSLFENEIKDRKDMLKTLSAVEVLYELAEHPHSNIFLLKASLLQHITDVINDPSTDSVVRSRASLISGRLLSLADSLMTIDQSCVTNLLLAIDKILRTEEIQNTDEIESALETLGLIGATTQGASFLFTDSSNVAKHVVELSFDRQGRGKQLAALHAFGSICGVDRQEDQIKLDDQAEERLKRLVYTVASNSPKLTPSGLLLSVLQQDPDVRIAGYRVLSGLVVREWCLREVCSKQEIIGIVTDPKMETTKLGMEARYACCVAVNKALSSSHLLHEPSLSELIGKLNEAVRRGPYLSDRKRVEAVPEVGTMQIQGARTGGVKINSPRNRWRRRTPAAAAMVKAYLHRYEPALSFGVVASPDSNVVHDPSGRLLLAAALDRFAAWDLKRGLPSATFTPSASSSLALAVSCLASSPAAASASSIASGHADGSIRLWDAETGACEATLHGHRSAASALRFAPSGAVLASGSKDCDVILWDVVAQAGLFRLRGHRDQVTDLLFLDSGKKLVTCSKDKFMRVWDLDMQHCLQIVGGHHSEIWSMDVDPAEKFLVSGSADPELRVFRIRQSADEGEDWNKCDALKLFGEIPRQTIERVQTIRFSKDGSLVACQVAGKTADIYRILDEAEAKTRLHSKKEKATVIDPLSAQDSQNPTLVVTDVFKLLQVLRTSNKICSLAFSPSNPPKGCLATLSLSLNNNVLQTYSVDNDKVSKMYSVELHGHRSAIRSLSLNSEDNLLMSTSHNAVKIWNPSTGNCLRTIDSGYGLCSAFVPGNRYGLVGTKTGTLEIIDINSGNSVDVIEAHSGSIQSIVLIPDEDGTVNARGFVTGSADHDVKFWEYQLVQKSYSDTKHLSVTNVRTLKMNDDVLAVSIGPTGKHIAVALLDCTVKVFFLDTLKFCLSLYGHELPVLCMDISSDGAFIVTGSAEKNLKIWGMDFGDCHKSIFAHTDSVMDVKFVPRTHYMFSVGKDRTVKYWDADKFELLLTLEGHHAEVWCLAVSSRGDFIVTGSHDRSIRRWDRTEEQLFIEEEREKRLEESFEADLDNAVEDRYGQKDDAPEEGSVGFPGKKTKETITAADAIIDALDTAEEEEKRRNEQKAQPAPPIAPVAPATSFARTPTQAPVSTAETAPPTAQPQAALPATVAASSRNNRINWDEDATTLFAQICSEEIIQSNIVGKPSKDVQERIRLRLLEEGNVNCSIPQVSNKWDAMKKLYNFYNKVKELPVEMQKKHFKTYANKTEYQKLKDGPPEDIKLMEIMFGNKEELPEKPNLTDEKAVMPASFGEVMKLAEVNKESSEKLSKKLEGVIEKLKDLRMLSKSIEQEVVALQMEFRNDMCNIGSVLKRLVYAAEKYYEVVAENERFINEVQELEGGAELLPMKKPAGRSVAGRTTAGRSAGRSVAGGGEATAKRMQKTTSRIGRLPPMKSANCKPKPPKTPDPGGPKSLGGRLFRREEEVEAGEQRETRRRVLSCLSPILEVPSLSEEGSSVVKRNSLKQKQENNANSVLTF